MESNITLTEKEYKKLSINFRKVASRLLNTDFNMANDNLERFLLFIEDSPIIYNYIQDNNKVKFDIEQIVKSRGYNEKFKLPVRQSEEIAFIYQMLNYVYKNNLDYYHISSGYHSGTKIQDAVDKFNQLVVKPLIDHIVTYLGEMAIDMELDKKSSTQYNINEFRGQLNHAETKGSITANQTYNESSIEELKELSEKFLHSLMESKEVQDTEKEETVEFVEATLQEIESDKPKKFIIKAAYEKIKQVIKVATTGSALLTFGEKLLEYLSPFIM